MGPLLETTEEDLGAMVAEAMGPMEDLAVEWGDMDLLV